MREAEQNRGPATGGVEEHLEEAARALEASGDYLVLRRLREVERYSADAPVQKRTAVYLDTETTGLDPAEDQIIELGLIAFEFDDDGNIYRLLRAGTQLEDPGTPLEPAITALTGIRDEDLAGKRIDEAEVERLLGSASLVIAHNAKFDRPFVERRLPRFAELPWACSMADIPWWSLGIGNLSMDYLAYRHGFFFAGHRALNDCRAGIHLLAQRDGRSGRTRMSWLQDQAARRGVKLWAEGAAYEKRVILRQRGYRWSSVARLWAAELPAEDLAAELAWLGEHVYTRRPPLPFVFVSALERYSERVPVAPPPGAERR